MIYNLSYQDFLESKMVIAPETGFDIGPDDVNKALLPHQRDAVIWAVKGGKRALFESFGLGKSGQQLEFCRIVVEREGGQALIVLPLGVKQEFVRDARELLKWNYEPPYVRTMAEVKAHQEPVLLTNYERVRDGDIDPEYFTATSLDEASVLRSFGSKTYQTFLDKFKRVRYKMVATATPSPNKYKELMPDREKVIKDSEEAIDILSKAEEPTFWMDFVRCVLENALALLKEQPEIVRCKDCKHWIPGYITDADDFIPSRCLDNHGVGWHADDYCSYGKRKEG